MTLVKRMRRRHFLVGAGGTVLALPFLRSLEPARAASFNEQFLFASMTQHGGVWPQHMYPAQSTLTDTHSIHSGHVMHYGRLQRSVQGGDVRLSDVLTAPEGLLSQDLLNQMMVLRGMDIAFNTGHTNGAVLGNYSRGIFEKDKPQYYVRTIDQVLADWNGFYSSTPRADSMHFGSDLSTNVRSSGRLDRIDPTESPERLFDAVLRGVAADPGNDDEPTPRTHVLNRVVDEYRGLTQGAFGDARRLSKLDKERLSDHMDAVADIVARIDIGLPINRQSCDPDAADSGIDSTGGDLNSRKNYEELLSWFRAYHAIVATAFACGASRLATVRVNQSFHHEARHWNDGTGWHNVAHEGHRSRESWGDSTLPQDELVVAGRNYFRQGFLDLVNRINAFKASDGGSLLDKGLAMWVQEAGPVTHLSDSLPVITAGSVDGYFRTGFHYDLRDRSTEWDLVSAGNNDVDAQRNPGILYNQWLSNILQSMGMSPSQFQKPSHIPDSLGWAGYGHAQRWDGNHAGEAARHYPSRLYSSANDKIPKVCSGT